MTKAQESTNQLTQKPVILDTPAGRQLAEWFRAFNSADANVLERFHAECDDEVVLKRFRAKERSLMDAVLYKQTGGLDFHRIEQSSDDEIVAVVQDMIPSRCQT